MGLTRGFVLTVVSSAESSVLPDQAREDIVTFDLADRKRDHVRLIGRCAKVQGPMRPMPVEVSGILAQHGPKVPLTEDQDPVGAFGACCPYPPLGEGVRSRRPWRDLEHLGAVAGQHVVEDPDERPVPVTIRRHGEAPARAPLASGCGGSSSR